MFASNLQRNDGSIVIHLTPNQSTPPLPTELQLHMSEGDWAYRHSCINRAVRRFSAPMFEKAWFGIALVATIVLPIVLYTVIANVIHNQLVTGSADIIKINQAEIELHAIGVGLFLGTLLLFWAPLAAWKAVGSIKIRKLLNSFEKEDDARSPGAFHPHWIVRAPGVFGTHGTVSITLPAAPPGFTSSFDPRAELPAYIAPAGQPLGYSLNEKTPVQRDFESVDMKV